MRDDVGAVGGAQERSRAFEPDHIVMLAPAEVPVVDFAPWLAPDASAEQRQSVGAALVAAARSHGFVQVVGHGVAEERVREMFDLARALFGLDDETKRRAPHPPGHAVHRGYSWPGLEKVSHLRAGDESIGVDVERERRVQDCKESFEVGSEGNASQPNVWLPETVLPEFRTTSTEFYWTLHALALEIITALALGLGLPSPEPHLRHHSGHGNQLRLLHYPPVRAEDVAAGRVARMPAHTDWGTVTLLLQDAVGGLQVERPDAPGVFIDVVPCEGALCVNVGDALMRWTNDHLKSTLHRVGLPSDPAACFVGPDGEQTRPRYSLVYFVSPDPDGDVTIEPLPSCVSTERPAKYAPILWEEHMLMRASTQYQSK